MSLSHRNVISAESPWTEEEKRETLYCPSCGKESVRWVRGDCRLQDGTMIPDLERWQCGDCGENLFDVPAMRRIREIRERLAPEKRSRRVSNGKTRKTNDA